MDGGGFRSGDSDNDSCWVPGCDNLADLVVLLEQVWFLEDWSGFIHDFDWQYLEDEAEKCKCTDSMF